MTQEISKEMKLTLKAIRKESDIVFINILSQLYYEGFDDGIRIGERNKYRINNLNIKDNFDINDRNYIKW